MRHSLFFIFLIFLLQGCVYDNGEDLYPNDCLTENLVYNGQMDALFNMNCATSNCHAPGVQGPDLSTYAGINANLERIKVRAVIQQTMPPARDGRLSICEKDQINQWIADGAPEN